MGLCSLTVFKKMISFFNRKPAWHLIVLFLLFLGGLLRLIDSTDPPLDFHSTRQMRNSLVARAIYYDLKADANPAQRLQAETFRRSVGTYEPPILESLVGATFLFTDESFVVPRVYQTIFWLTAGLALFNISRRSFQVQAAILALAYFLILPFSVQASRSFQPDPLMTAMFVVGLFFLARWSEHWTQNSLAPGLFNRTWTWAVLAGLFLGFSVLIKIVIVFMVAGAAIGLVLFTVGGRFWKLPQVWVIAGLSFLPAFGYYVIGTPARSTEYFFAWTLALIKLIISPDFYSKWLAFIGSLFGLTLLILGILGALISPPRLRWMLVGAWIGYVLYGLTLPFQMYTHSYYHDQLIPIIALGLAGAATPLVDKVTSLSTPMRASIVLLLVAVIGYYAWVARSVLMAEDFRDEPFFWREIGNAIPANTNVIGLTQDYGYRLMYWGWRKVNLWPLDTDLKEARGGDPAAAAADFDHLAGDMDYFLITAFGQLEKQPELKGILEGYPIAVQGNGYVLYDLNP